ncbi:PIN-like domain-containing protein, partial [Pseudanabaena sp. 'Roaring Creek']|uniref:PIN-like domain-containing protein n=1 Tax=Pseudanabaena sp. 'Roaring Creek' TaxID=1681830 RepID=UPI000A53F87E
MTEQVANSMKDLFPGYYLPTEEEFIELWKSGIFVLDTNVLLKLYKYDQKTCDDFFKVLRVVSDRLWIPHQVALEFQENRVSTIN